MGSGEDGIMVVNGAELETQFTFMEKINEKEQYVTKVGKRNNAPNSDHYPFTQKGIPAFFIYTMGNYKYYHSPMDNADNLQLSSVYSRVFALLYDFIENINK
jgi:Zn-dependent M28 family amino/carboxypeptidase